MTRTAPVGDELHRMVTFALWWYPYGGGRADDIFVAFGIDARTFFDRVAAAARSPETDLSAVQRTELLALCLRRLERLDGTLSTARPGASGNGLQVALERSGTPTRRPSRTPSA